MIYFLETNLQKTKSVKYSLNQIFGINISLSKDLCKKLGFSTNLKISDLSEDQLKSITKLIEISNIKTNSDLKNYNRLLLNNLVNIKSYRGLRRLAKLPVRGQRTHTNAKTCKKIF